MGIGVENQVLLSSSDTPAKKKTKFTSLGDFFPGRISTEDIASMYLSRATCWSIDTAQPFTTFAGDSFRAMFEPFHNKLSDAHILKAFVSLP